MPKGHYKRAPRALTPEVVDALVGAFERGAIIRSACGLAGISAPSFHRWMNKGRELAEQFEGEDLAQVPDAIDELYIDLFRRVERALAECVVNALDHMHTPEPGRWQAWAWLLERRFGYRQSMEIETVGEGAEDRSTALALEIVRELSADVEDIRPMLERGGVKVV